MVGRGAPDGQAGRSELRGSPSSKSSRTLQPPPAPNAGVTLSRGGVQWVSDSLTTHREEQRTTSNHANKNSHPCPCGVPTTQCHFSPEVGWVCLDGSGERLCSSQPKSAFRDLLFQLEIGHSGSIYTMEIGRCCNQSQFPRESQLNQHVMCHGQLCAVAMLWWSDSERHTHSDSPRVTCIDLDSNGQMGIYVSLILNSLPDL